MLGVSHHITWLAESTLDLFDDFNGSNLVAKGFVQRRDLRPPVKVQLDHHGQQREFPADLCTPKDAICKQLHSGMNNHIAVTLLKDRFISK